MGIYSLLCWIFAIFGGFQVILTATSYHGYKLYRIESPSQLVMSYVEGLEADGNRFTDSGERMPLVDIWSEPNAVKNALDVLVAPEFCEVFLDALRKKGVERIETLKNDIQRDIDREKRRSARRLRRSHTNHQSHANSGPKYSADAGVRNSDDFDLNSYNRYQKIVKYLRHISEKNQEHTEFINATKTFEGRDLVGIKIAKDRSNKPTVFIDAGIHAREWIAPAVALYLIDKLVKRSAEDEEIVALKEKFNFIIFPVVNPDGYEYSHAKDRFWRKTRSRNLTKSKWCVGADGNRNWGYQWGEAGANRSPCSNIYTGESPFSEIEMAGIRDYINWKVTNMVIYMSLHSYGQLFLSPWGYTEEKPHNYDDQQMAAKMAVEAIKNATDADYHYGSIAELMYPASGTSIDYMQHRGVPYIYGIELRPEDLEDNYGFTIPSEWIEPTGKEMLVALKKITEYVVKQKRL